MQPWFAGDADRLKALIEEIEEKWRSQFRRPASVLFKKDPKYASLAWKRKDSGWYLVVETEDGISTHLLSAPLEIRIDAVYLLRDLRLVLMTEDEVFRRKLEAAIDVAQAIAAE